jgi:F-type H+-transporting ATPase subunit alpha
MLRRALHQVHEAIREALDAAPPALAMSETGEVVRIGSGVARVRGLPSLMSEERVEFDGGSSGIAIDLEPGEAGIVMLDPGISVAAGTRVRTTGRFADTPIGRGLLGRVIDPMGRPLDGGGPVRADGRKPVEASAPAIMDRAAVVTPLATGLKIVDALIPVGRGQRELIVGDRQTGKTSVAVDTILNQRASGVLCVYCAIGQRGAAVARVIETLRRGEALTYSVVVVAGGEDPPGLQYLAPYAAMTIAESFMAEGRDALVVLDDLTRHARAYREISLLLRRPPGREAFPGDIFYLHARLLERSARLAPDRGGGSLTALPIVETQAQDIAAYIPTNLISITDGQVYLSPDLFHRGILPAIDVGRSVSRVGGKTQLPALRAIAGRLRLSFAQFEELESFARFATRLDDRTRATIERGRRVREALKQPEHAPMSPLEQVAVLHAVTSGAFDAADADAVAGLERRLRSRVGERCADVGRRIADGEPLDEADWALLHDCAQDAIRDAESSP